MNKIVNSTLDAFEYIKCEVQDSKTLEEALSKINDVIVFMKVAKAKEDEEQKQQIEYEQIEIQVPKSIMNLLRYAQDIIEQTPKEFIEYYTIETVRSQIDAGQFLPDALQLTNQFKLNPIFKEIINDPVTKYT
jgi:hypothetical protein